MILNEPILAGAGVRHGFFGRRGGVSEGVYTSLNCGLGSGDDPARVRENRRRALERLDVADQPLVTARQVHSARVAVVQRPWPDAARPDADGLVTRTPGLVLGVLTADCAPVLLADRERGVVGAAHAGWRGAKDGIVAATVAAMEALGARRAAVTAIVGPCIGAASYEVGAEFVAAFVDDDPASAAFFVPAQRPRHHLFDLPAFVRARLAACGIGDIGVVGHDTYADGERYFSFRRTTHDGGGDYGRQLSAIALAPEPMRRRAEATI